MEPEQRSKFFCGACCLTFFISLFLFAFSFGVVEVLHQGIVINENTMEIDPERTYPSGRYFIGLGRSFLTFPSSYQTMRFGTYRWLTNAKPDTGDVECRTKDKMQLFIEVTAQFQISSDPHDLVRLFYDFGEYSSDESIAELTLTNMRKTYSAIGTKVFRDVIAGYLSTEIVQNRNEIESRMEQQFDKALQRLYARVVSFEMVNMEFDSGGLYATAIEKTQVAKQQIKEMENKLLVAGVKAEATSESANKTAQILLASASSYSKSLLAAANADATALLYKTQKQVVAYSTLKQQLGLNSTATLMHYLWMSSVQNNAKSAISMEYPETILKGMGSS